MSALIIADPDPRRRDEPMAVTSTVSAAVDSHTACPGSDRDDFLIRSKRQKNAENVAEYDV